MRPHVIPAVLAAAILVACTYRASEATPPARPTVGAPELMPRTPHLERPWSSDADRFHFAILGDKTGGGEENWPIFDAAVDEISLMQPDFVIMVGDLIQGSTRDTSTIASMWDEFWQHAGRLQAPFFYLPGNHDISNEVMYRYWRGRFGQRYYSFDYLGCHFVALNTEETWGGGQGGPFGEEQVRFVEADLARSAGARHTFVFMHKPAWQGEGNPEWARVEAALGDRPYTVFAGHRHTNGYEVRNGRRHIVLGPTGAGIRPMEIRELGVFHHWTWITVDGDSAYVAYVEPGGRMWPVDVAPQTFRDAVSRLLDVSARLPETPATSTVRTGIVATITNRLPDTVHVVLETVRLDATAWRTADGSRTAVVPPGGDEELEVRYDVPSDHVVPAPRIRAIVRYKDSVLYGIDRNAPVYPDSTLRRAPAWQVVGYFNAGPTPNQPPRNPREVMPKAFLRYGPEDGYRTDATFQGRSGSIGWREVTSSADGSVDLTPLFSTPDSALAYALCGVYSPHGGTVYGEFRADDYGQIIVNGEMIEDGRLFRTRSDATYVALPLQSGWNAVVVKTMNIAGGWGFRLRVADPENVLRFASHPE